MKKVLTKIGIKTLPNGYALSFDGHEFMYYNEVDLLAGFLARVGSGKTEDMEKGSILNCLFDVMLGERYANDIDKLTKTVAKLQATYTDKIQKLSKEISIVESAIESHKILKAKVEYTSELAVEMREKYKEASVPYKEYNDRISKLEHSTRKMEDYFQTATKKAEMKLEMIDQKLNDLSGKERQLIGKAETLLFKLQHTGDGQRLELSDDDEESVAGIRKKTNTKKSRRRNTKADKAVEEVLEEKFQEHWKNDPNIK